MAREIPLQKGWRFYAGDDDEAFWMGFDDGAWRPVELPHDWAVAGPFDRRYASGTGYLPGGTGWYRLRFTLPPEAAGQRALLRFDGVYGHARVWCNSHYLGTHAYGYTPFSFDLSPFVRAGENVLAVRVEHEETADSRWYAGSGIYRDVTLALSDPAGFSEYGVFLYTAGLEPDGAALLAGTCDAPGADRVRVRLLRDGEPVALWEGPPGETALRVPAARLWSPEDPYLYRAEFEALRDGLVADTRSLSVGIRTARFDPDRGFFLNGSPVKLKGVCVHHDAGCLGAAFYEPVWERRLRRLKAAGCNALRTAHNPPAEALLRLCDRLGILVMDEAFDEWEGCKNKWWQGHNVYPPRHHGYAADFPEWHERDLTAMIRRDRIHPCVILWSIGNEIDYPNDPYVTPLFDEALGNNDGGKPAAERRYDDRKPDASRLAAVAARLTAIAHGADRTRPVLSAMSFPELSTRTGFAEPLDLWGYNYRENRYDGDHAAFPDRVILGSENGHDPAAWEAVLRRPFIAGQFLWTGIDFLGECRGWPLRISQAGLLDLCGFEKPLWYRRKALWTDAPFVKLAVSVGDAAGTNVWTDTFCYAAAPGEPVCVSAYTNTESAELFVNGRSLGARTRVPDDGCRLTWEFPYEPGEVTVLACGQTDALRTPGEPAALRLTPAEPADGRLLQVEVLLADAAGTPVRRDLTLRYQLRGRGRLLGVENGAPDDLTPYGGDARRTLRGRAIVYLLRDTPADPLELYVYAEDGDVSALLRLEGAEGRSC